MAKLGGGIYIPMTIDVKGVKVGIDEANRQFAQFSRNVQTESNKINISTGSIVRGFTAISGIHLGISGLRDFASEVTRMTGVMQGLSLSFETMLGSKAAADQMMMDVKQFALATPYTITETAATVKQLIAMNAAGDNVMETYKALGDVAAGLNVPLQRIAINFGQVAALGKLQAREVRDFAMAGVPIWDELANVMGKNVQEIQALVSAGKVGFKDVLDAFKAMSGEGGRFNNMMEKMNSTVLGQINRLQDQIEQMFGSIGDANKGFIYDVIGGAATIVSNYKEIIDILKQLIIAYGAYWAAQKVVNTISVIGQNTRYNAEIKALEQLILAKKGNQNADLQQLVNDKKITASQAQRIAALRAELVAEQQLEVKRANQALITAQRRLDTLAINENTTATQLNNAQNKVKSAQDRVNVANLALSSAQEQIDTAATNANTAAKKRLTATGKATMGMFRSLGAVLKSSAIGLAMAGIALAIQSIVQLSREASQATREMEEAINNASASIQKEVVQLDIMYDRLRQATKGTVEYDNARKAIESTYGSHINSIRSEGVAVNDLEQIYEKLRSSIEAAALARANEQVMSEQARIIAEQYSESFDRIEETIRERTEDDPILYERYLNAIRSALQGEEITDEIQTIIDEFNDIASQGSIIFGSDQWSDIIGERWGNMYIVNRIQGEINKMNSTRQQVAQALENATYKFSTTTANDAAEQIDVIAAAFNQLNPTLDVAEKRLKTIMTNGATKEDIQAQEEYIALIKQEIEQRIKSGNTSYEYESKRKKEAEDAIQTLVKGTDEWKIQNNIIQEATERLKKYGQESKTILSKDEVKRQNDLHNAILELEKIYTQTSINTLKDGEERRKREQERIYNEQLLAARDQLAKIANLRAGEDSNIQGISLPTTDTPENRQVLSGLGFSTEEIDKYYAYLIDLAKVNANAIKKIESDALAERLRGLMSFAQEYNSRYLKLQENLAKEGITQEAKIRATSEFEIDIAGLASKFSETDPIFKAWADKIKAGVDGVLYLGASELFSAAITSFEQQLAEAQSRVNTILADNNVSEDESSALQLAYAQIERLKKVISELKGESSKSEKGIFKDWTRTNKLINQSIDVFGELGDAVGGAAGDVIDTLGTIAGSILQIIGGIQTAQQTAATAIKATTDATNAGIMTSSATAVLSIKAVESASVILLVISAVIQAVTAIMAANEKNAQAQEETAKKAYEAARKYAKALADIQRDMNYDRFETFFGTDSIGQAITAYEELQDAIRTTGKTLQELNDIQNLITGPKGSIENIGILGRAAAEQGKTLAELYSLADGIEADIVTEGASGKDYHAYTYFDPNEFLNADGTFKEGGFQAMQDWYETYGEHLEQWEKDVIETFLRSGEDAQKAMEILTQYMGQLWGDLASDISQSMIESFLETGDAMKGLEDVAQSVAKSMAQSFLNSFILKEIFPPDFQDKVFKLLGSGDLEGANNEIQGALDKLNSPETAALLEWIAEAFGLTADEMERASASQGIAQASQDSIDALTGIITNIENNVWSMLGIQEQMLQIMNGGRSTIDTSIDMGDSTQQDAIRSAVFTMNANVARIRENTDRLANIEAYLRDTNNTIKDIPESVRKIDNDINEKITIVGNGITDLNDSFTQLNRY